MRIIKQTREVGTSAGVLLPRGWLNKQVVVELINPDLNSIKKKAIEILIEENLLQDVLGIYLTGSYSREEQTYDSDIDILVITSNINKRIKKDIYDLLLVSDDLIEKKLKNNALPILPMLKEAKVILNKGLIEKYKNTKLTRKNLKWHIETTKSAMNVNKASLDLDKEFGLEKTGDSTAYSLILRLRGIYIINSLKKNKSWSKKELLSLINKISGSTIAYDRYLYLKNNKGKSKDILPIVEAEKLHNYIKKENEKQERWLKEKRD